jgi:signal transduction histidine kinase
MGAGLKAFLTRPFSAATWRDTAYLLLGAATGAVAFAALVVAVTVGVVMTLTILGIPVLIACFALLRVAADVDRQRARMVLRRPIERRYKAPREPRLLSRLGAAVTDPQSWKDMLWLALAGLLGLADAIIAATVWATGIGSISMLAWWWAVDDSPEDDWGLFRLDGWDKAVYWALIGIGICLLAPWVMRVLAVKTVVVAQLLLAPGRKAALEERVLDLAESRAGAVELQSAELQRIERDLHDGAQARLVALAMDLGRARERIESHPDEARDLVIAAHEESKVALRELRDLVRGVYPGILSDRGLDAALSALAARSPVPVELSVDVGVRPPATVEAAAYFVVAEALANVAKHSAATACAVHVTRANGTLEVVVEDDGHGGADPAAGTGLAGLERRVRALDGTLTVEGLGPAGTRLRAEIPCGP